LRRRQVLRTGAGFFALVAGSHYYDAVQKKIVAGVVPRGARVTLRGPLSCTHLAPEREGKP
jgi:hypothetical protein